MNRSPHPSSYLAIAMASSQNTTPAYAAATAPKGSPGDLSLSTDSLTTPEKEQPFLPEVSPIEYKTTVHFERVSSSESSTRSSKTNTSGPYAKPTTPRRSTQKVDLPRPEQPKYYVSVEKTASKVKEIDVSTPRSVESLEEAKPRPSSVSRKSNFDDFANFQVPTKSEGSYVHVELPEEGVKSIDPPLGSTGRGVKDFSGRVAEGHAKVEVETKAGAEGNKTDCSQEHAKDSASPPDAAAVHIANGTVVPDASDSGGTRPLVNKSLRK